MKQNLVVYMCGRRTGIPDKGYAAIEGAVARLRSFGLQVVSPIDVNINALGADYSPQHDPQFRPAYPGLRMDIITMMSLCNAISLMPGWDQAIGCRAEVALAITMGFTFVDWCTGKPCKRPESITVSYGYGEGHANARAIEERNDEEQRLGFGYPDSPARIG